MSPLAILHEIEKLDSVKDHQRIVFLSCCYEFPFDTIRALEFALFRTFCVPSISALLDRTGEFQQGAQKRYDDTDLIINELIESGYDGERGQRGLRRMNQQQPLSWTGGRRAYMRQLDERMKQLAAEGKFPSWE